jgi:hypothetical protein
VRVASESTITLQQQAAETLRRQVAEATMEKDDADRRVTAVEAELALLQLAPGATPGGGGGVG